METSDVQTKRKLTTTTVTTTDSLERVSEPTVATKPAATSVDAAFSSEHETKIAATSSVAADTTTTDITATNANNHSASAAVADSTAISASVQNSDENSQLPTTTTTADAMHEPRDDLLSIESRRRFFHDHLFIDETSVKEGCVLIALEKDPPPPLDRAAGTIQNASTTSSASSVPTRNGHVRGCLETAPNTGGEEQQEEDKNTDHAVEVISSVPTLFNKLERHSKVENKFLSQRRPAYVSRTVDQLEQSIRSLHHERSRNDERIGSSSPDDVCAVTLQFNECSVASISRWVSGQLERPNHHSTVLSHGADTANAANSVAEHPLPDAPPYYFCAVNAFFRKCGICNKTGHYELECSNQTNKQTRQLLELAEEGKYVDLPDQPLLQPPEEQQHESQNSASAAMAEKQNPPPPNQRKRRKPGSVVTEASLEMCNGFLVEQRSDAWSETPAVDLTEASSSTQQDHVRNGLLDITDIDGFIIRASNQGACLDQIASFNKGDIVCWFSSGGPQQSKLHAGVLITPFNSSDLEGDASVRCISVIASQQNNNVKQPNDNSGESDEALGKTFTVSKAEIFSVKDALTMKGPPEENLDGSSNNGQVPGNSSAPASGVNSNGTSRSKEMPQRRKHNVKFDRPRAKRSPF